jgi:hypothetical protein
MNWDITACPQKLITKAIASAAKERTHSSRSRENMPSHLIFKYRAFSAFLLSRRKIVDRVQVHIRNVPPYLGNRRSKPERICIQSSLA